MGYLRILAAIPGFFLMLLWHVISPKLGITADISYITAMLVTITMWLAVAPLAAVGQVRRHRQ
jgi:hypothetical protein